MRVTIHQPDFLPWLGYFHRWAKSDLFIILDDVQFIKRGWHHRDKIKTTRGSSWLTVPVKKKGRYLQKIKDVEIDNEQNWRLKHLRTIENTYKKAPNFDRCFAALKEIYAKEHSFLTEFNIELLMYLASEFTINTPLDYASKYNLDQTLTDRLVQLVKVVGGTTYLTGLGSKEYLDEASFQNAGIALEWQVFEHPAYQQLHGLFEPMLSALDYLMMTSKHIF